eukprot:5289211-Karenia_brevis.AAC.1
MDDDLRYSKPDKLGQWEHSILIEGKWYVLCQAKKKEMLNDTEYMHLVFRSSFPCEGGEWNVAEHMSNVEEVVKELKAYPYLMDIEISPEEIETMLDDDNEKAPAGSDNLDEVAAAMQGATLDDAMGGKPK